MQVFRIQATNSSEFFDKEYLAPFGRAQASLALLLLARCFFFEEVFSPWHSKQASSAHDLAKTFLSFCILFPRETRERPLCLFVVYSLHDLLPQIHITYS